MSNQKIVAYIGIVDDKDNSMQKIKIFGDKEESIIWAKGGGLVPAEKSESISESDTGSAINSLKSLMNKSVEFNRIQMSLVSVTNGFGSLIPKIVYESDISNKVIREERIVISEGNIKVYAIDYDMIPDLLSSLKRVSDLARGLSNLPQAIFLSSVSSFDSFSADLVRIMLRIKSDKLKAGGKSISLSSVLNAKSLEDLVANIVDDEVYQFSRGSHDSQVEYIETAFDIKIRSHWKRWPDFIEVFERRNLIAHGEDSFTKRYVDICSKNGHKGSEDLFNKPVEVRAKYLRQAIDLLSEFLILSVFSLWRKHLSDSSEEAFGSLNGIVYSLIEDKRYNLASRLADFCLSISDKKFDQACRLMMTVNLASAHKHLKEDDACTKILDQTDWSATSARYQICVSALREDVGQVCKIMHSIGADQISKDDFRSWPVFNFVNRKKEFQDSFKIKYNEEYEKSALDKISTKSDGNELTIENEEVVDKKNEDTVH